MLTLQTPMLLALLGTALMAVVIFAPSRVAAPVGTPFAPPHPPPAVERWEPSPAFEPWEPAPGFECAAAVATEPLDAPLWPTLIHRRAAGCDPAARLALVEALAAVRSPWSDAILRRALDDELDGSVREAVIAALRV